MIDLTNVPESTSTWTLEGPTPVDGGTERRRWTLDRESGLIEREESASGHADVVLDDHYLVLPGILDLHVHCRDDPSGVERYKEDFSSATRAALHGGVVLVGDMPNNPVAPVDPETLAAKRALIESSALVDVVPYVGVTAEPHPLCDDAPYKCYYGPSVGDLHLQSGPDAPTPLARFRGRLVAFHAESHEVLEASRNAATHEERRPPEAESRAVAEIAILAREHGFLPHIAHLSSAAGLGEVKKARAAGVTMTCEVAPHHLLFDHENRGELLRGAWLQMNPPLRARADRMALTEALESGEIEMIATDHAPHSLSENENGISGVPWLDTLGAVLTLLQRDTGMTWAQLADRTSAAPARIFGRFLPGRFGATRAGHVASLTVLDLASPWTVRAEDLHTRAGWSPLEGLTTPGRVALTVVRGRPHGVG